MVMILLFVAVVVIALMVTLHRRQRRAGWVAGAEHQPDASRYLGYTPYHGGLDGGGSAAAGGGGCDGGGGGSC
ncbi:hypothetical protein AB0M02_40815 [Actinoplanes sp. NPDC051861]|uniref:hypothetical protein n=1 Tax=Actinoplanes sp. NPDC051861 TaxID=3155170 RepID=UPI00342EE037